MPLFAILTADKTRVDRVEEHDSKTVFKPGFVFPAVLPERPIFDPKTQSISLTWPLPDKGTVTGVWMINALDQTTKDDITERDTAATAKTQLKAALNNWGTLNASQKDAVLKGLAWIALKSI